MTMVMGTNCFTWAQSDVRWPRQHSYSGTMPVGVAGVWKRRTWYALCRTRLIEFFERREMKRKSLILSQKSKLYSPCTTTACSVCVITQALHPGTLPLRGKEEWGHQHQLSCAIPARKQRKLEQQRTQERQPPQPPSLFHTFAHDTGLTPGLGPGEKTDESQWLR